MLTKAEMARFREINAELARLSRGGWDKALHSDYHPLEAELEQLRQKAARRRQLKGVIYRGFKPFK
jgi:hypothetical protein